LLFYVAIECGVVWLPGGAETLTGSKRMTGSPKPMPDVFWSPLGFSLDELPLTGWHFDALCLDSKVLCGIRDGHLEDTAEHQR
jgi:hypothetical protein